MFEQQEARRQPCRARGEIRMIEAGLSRDRDQRELELHRRAIVVDMALSGSFAHPAIVRNGKSYQARAAEGGLTAAVLTLAGERSSFRSALANAITHWRLAESQPEKFLIVKDAEDIHRAKREGKIGMIFGFQNGTPLEDDWLNNLVAFWHLGIRLIQLTYNERNLIGSGCLERNDGGLSAYGLQVVHGMNRYGILIDLAHTGNKTSLDVVEVSEDPVVITHANPKALNPSFRNKPDEVIKALAARGGVIGLVSWNVLVEKEPGKRPTINDYIDHINYVVDLVGIDHVGIGSDINDNFRALPVRSEFEEKYHFMLGAYEDIASAWPDGFSGVEEFPNLTRALMARGYSDEDIQRILGGNFLRVAQQVWGKRPSHR